MSEVFLLKFLLLKLRNQVDFHSKGVLQILIQNCALKKVRASIVIDDLPWIAQPLCVIHTAVHLCAFHNNPRKSVFPATFYFGKCQACNQVE